MKLLKTLTLSATIIFSLLSLNSVSQDAGIFQTYVTLDYNGTLKYFEGGASGFNHRNAESFNGHYLGTFNSSDNISLAGAEIHTWKNNGGDVTGGEVNYSIYKTGGTPSFSSVAMDFCCNDGDNNACNSGEPCTDVGSGNQRWSKTSESINILSGLDPGEYTIQVYFRATTNVGDRFDSDPGNGDYQATFTIGTDGFFDGDLTSGTVWSGETSSFSIIDPTTLSGDGSNSFLNGSNVENDQVLVSNSGIGDAVITTPSDMAYGVWQFSLATAESWATSASNGVRVILISDTDDPSKLKDGSFDFNGYYVDIGQSGSTDYFELVKVNGSAKTSVINSAYPSVSGPELGYRIKVTRAFDGSWEIFIDEGFDGSSASTSRGTGNDNEHMDCSFFGLSTEVTTTGDLRRGYFDNISLNPYTEVSFDTNDSQNDESDGSVTLTINLANPSSENDTQVDVVIIKGDPSRIDNYTTQMLTFPAGSSAPQTLDIDITDNDLCDYNTEIVFELQNVTGGNSATAADPDTFTLSIVDDNAAIENQVSDNFEDGDLMGWTGETSTFSNQNSSVLSGNQALYSSSIEVDGSAYLVLPNEIKDLNGTQTTWRFSVATGIRDPNDLNRFTVMLTSNNDDPTSAGIQGYAVAVNEAGNTDDRLRLYRVDDNSSATQLITYETPGGWGSFDNFAIEVTRSESGDWELFINDTVDFSNLVSTGTATDNTYDFMGSMTVVSHQDLGDWEVWFDDIDVVQEFCSGQYETTGSGTVSTGIWQLVGTAAPASPPFNKYTDLTVKSGHNVTVDGTYRTRNITVDSSGTLDMSSENALLETFGDMNHNGSGEVKIHMTGNLGAQSISGTSTPDFYELTVNNPDGVSMSLDANFYGPIHPERGTLDFSGQTIVMASDNINGTVLTGSIGEIKTGADVIGDITMQRYIESVNDGYRLIGMPVTGQTVASAFSGDFDMTGFTGSNYPDHYFTNVKFYDETQHAMNDYNTGFVDVSSMTEAIDPTKGYWAYIPEGTSNYVLDATGAFNKGDITINLDYTSLGDGQFDGWNCVVNPYPSSIDIMSSDITLVNCERAAYILDHTLGSTWKGEYVSYNNGVSNNGGSNILSSYQAFFIKATGPGASITFNEGCKVDDQASFLRFDDISRELLRFSVSNGENRYETAVSFHDQATDNYDPDFDGYFLESNTIEEGGLSLATLNGANTFSVNTLSNLDEPVSIPFIVNVPLEGDYEFSLDNIQNLSSTACFVIEDIETESFHTVYEGSTIAFTAPNDVYTTNRFILHAYPSAEVTSSMASCFGAEDGEIVLEHPGYDSWEVIWTDLENNILSSSNGQGSSILSDLTAGTYIAQLTNPNGHCTSMTQEVIVHQPSPEEVQILSQATICSEEIGQVDVMVTNSNEWTASAYNDGSLISENSGSSTVTLSDLAAGEYIIQVTTECLAEEFAIDLTDENAVSASFQSIDEVVLNNGIAEWSPLNTSQNADQYEWYINGSLVSQEEDFVFEFLEPGLQNISLTASNTDCHDEFDTILLVSTADNTLEYENEFSIIDFGSYLSISSNFSMSNYSLEIHDNQGKTVLVQTLNGSSVDISKSELSKGIYSLSISSKEAIVHRQKIIK